MAIASLSAWWAAWRYVAVLTLLLSLSAGLNVWQAYRALTAPMRAENRALIGSLERVEQIAAGRNRDDAALLANLDQIAKRGQAVRVEYRTISADNPLPEQCAPGQQRVDAINRALGAKSGEERK